MCGIAGVVSPGRTAPELGALVDAMLERLIHRGPDSGGTYVADGIAIGARRLAIIDIEGGAQPIGSETGRVRVVQNGEIYNHASLRTELEARGHRFRTRSDTEVLAHGWEEWSTGLLDRLNGMFAFAAWDAEERRLFLARDRMGIKPLYWAQRGDELLFASELKALLATGLVPVELDMVALGQFLVFEYVPAPRSILRGVNKLEAATLLSCGAGVRPTLRRYWQLRFEPERSVSRGETRERTLDAIDRAVRMELMSDVPVGVLLSGGVDSTAVTLAATRASARTPKTFTIRFDDRSFDESEDALEVAQRLGTDHRTRTLHTTEFADLAQTVARIVDEPIADSSLLPTYLLAQFAREHVTVALGGDGGDELWAGYPTMLAHRAAAWYRRVPEWLRRRLVEPAVRRLPVSSANLSLEFRLKRFIQGVGMPSELQHHLWIGGYSPEGARALIGPDGPDGLGDESLFEPILRLEPAAREMEPMDRLLFLDASLYLEGDVLTKIDRAAMACSLEVRVPLLNREVVEVARRVPFEWKQRGRTGKALLREAIAPYVPRRAVIRGKKGFNLPISGWLRGPGADLLADLSDHLPGFDRARVGTLVHDHLSGRRDNRKLLWPLVVLRLWDAEWRRTPPAVGRRA